MQDKILKLTNTVYRVLEFFPESDPLKNRAKDRALQILENLMEAAPRDGASLALLGRDIDVLLGYLWIGKMQGWLNSVNFLIISNEYDKITLRLRSGQEKAAPSAHKVGEMGEPRPEGREIEPMIGDTSVPQTEKPKTAPATVLTNTEPETPFSLSGRQSKILDFLNKNEKAQVMDLRTILPDVTKRTIRRDLDELLEAGKIVRMGEFNQVFYKIK